MANKITTFLSKETGKSVKTIENKWEKAKEIASKKLKEGSPRFYALTTSILKKMVSTKD